MKLVTYVPAPDARIRNEGRAGLVYHSTQILDVETLLGWARRQGTTTLPSRPAPVTMLELLRQQEGMAAVRAALATAEQARPEDLSAESGLVHTRSSVSLRAPVPDAPSFRD